MGRTTTTSLHLHQQTQDEVEGVKSENKDLTTEVEGVESKNKDLTTEVEGVKSKNKDLTTEVELETPMVGSIHSYGPLRQTHFCLLLRLLWVPR